jgi:hypothetical protein
VELISNPEETPLPPSLLYPSCLPTPRTVHLLPSSCLHAPPFFLPSCPPFSLLPSCLLRGGQEDRRAGGQEGRRAGEQEGGEEGGGREEDRHIHCNMCHKKFRPLVSRASMSTPDSNNIKMAGRERPTGNSQARQSKGFPFLNFVLA